MLVETTREDPFIQWLREQVKAAGISYREASRRAGLSDSSVSDYLAGRRHPLPAACRQLARLFGVAEDSVLSLAGHRSAAPRTDLEYEGFFSLLREQPPAVLAEVERWVRPFLRSYWEARQPERGSERAADLSIQLRWDELDYSGDRTTQ